LQLFLQLERIHGGARGVKVVLELGDLFLEFGIENKESSKDLRVYKLGHDHDEGEGKNFNVSAGSNVDAAEDQSCIVHHLEILMHICGLFEVQICLQVHEVCWWDPHIVQRHDRVTNAS